MLPDEYSELISVIFTFRKHYLVRLKQPPWNQTAYTYPPQMKYYSDKIVWVTGASSGIGEALIPQLLRHGARVILSARRESELQRVFNDNGGNSDRMLVLPLDLSKHDTLQEVVSKAEAWHGRIDILINNGGISQRAFVHETSLEVEKQIFDVNYFGTVELTRQILPGMLRRKAGHIVVISSVLGKMSIPLRSSYCSSKHALHGYFDALRAEIHQIGIDITMVCPGYVKTDVSINALKADGQKHATLDKTQARGMRADVFCNKMLRKVSARRREFNVGGPEILAVYMQRLFPWLVSRVTQRLTPAIRQNSARKRRFF